MDYEDDFGRWMSGDWWGKPEPVWQSAKRALEAKVRDGSELTDSEHAALATYALRDAIAEKESTASQIISVLSAMASSVSYSFAFVINHWKMREARKIAKLSHIQSKAIYDAEKALRVTRDEGIFNDPR